MNAAWSAILRQPVLAWRLQGTWGTWMLMAGAVLGFCGFGIGMNDWHAGVTATGVFVAALTIVWWIQLLGSAIRQNEPALACLVPHQRRRIVTVVALLWLAGSLAVGIIFGVGLGHFGYALLAGSATLLFFAAVQRYPMLAIGPVATIVVTRYLPLPSLEDTLATLGEAGSVTIGMAVVLALGGALARQLFPRGGDRHMRWHRQYVDRANAIREAQAVPGQERTVWRAASWLDRMYLAGLRRLCERAGLAATPRNRAYALLYALGGAAHPGAGLVGVAAIVLPAVAAGASLRDFLGGPSAVVPICTTFLIIPLVIHVHAVTVAMQRFRTEQALLRLCPAAPATPDFNRQFGTALLRRFGIVWLASTAGAALVAAIIVPGIPAQAAVGVTAALTLMLATGLMRDYASIARLSTATMVVAIIAIAVLAVVLKGVATLYQTRMPWWPIGVLATAALGLAWYRWRRMPSLPVAFPAGRLAAD